MKRHAPFDEREVYVRNQTLALILRKSGASERKAVLLRTELKEGDRFGVGDGS